MRLISSARTRWITRAIALFMAMLGTGGCTYYSVVRVPNRDVWLVSGPGTAPTKPADKPMALRLESGRLEFDEDEPAAVKFSDGKSLSLGTQAIPARALREIGTAPSDFGSAFTSSLVVSSLLGSALDRLPSSLAEQIRSPNRLRRDRAARLAREILADEPLIVRGRLGAWIVSGWYSLGPDERTRLRRALQHALNLRATRPDGAPPTSRPG